MMQPIDIILVSYISLTLQSLDLIGHEHLFDSKSALFDVFISSFTESLTPLLQALDLLPA